MLEGIDRVIPCHCTQKMSEIKTIYQILTGNVLLAKFSTFHELLIFIQTIDMKLKQIHNEAFQK